jgi:hypothetical protein
MKSHRCATVVLASVVSLGLAVDLFANGGPFVVKYPQGDPAAKGVLARLESDLRPGQITDLRVLKEDLTIRFGADREMLGEGGKALPPLVRVSAAYTIENPADREVTVDFGFPILRGIYISPFSMMPRPEVDVTINDRYLQSQIISNSMIYGLIRQQARELIEKSIAADAKLAGLVAACKPAPVQKVGKGGVLPDAAAAIAPAREALAKYAGDTLKWKERDVALLVEYATIHLGARSGLHAFDSGARMWGWGAGGDPAGYRLIAENLGPLAAIGEQKATQFLAQVASCFDAKAAATYESIFSAWGGDVRERSVDLNTGKLRPRELTVDKDALGKPDWRTAGSDPTVYARVDYLDPNAKITDSEKASCQSILKNLPVVFTFAPMNLLYYQANFPARSTQVLTVSYTQYAFIDTGEPASYQIAYVIHPASMWKDFGPINLKVAAPPGVMVKASVALGAPQDEAPKAAAVKPAVIYPATLSDKTGELLVGVDRQAWDKATAPPAKPGK